MDDQVESLSSEASAEDILPLEDLERFTFENSDAIVKGRYTMSDSDSSSDDSGIIWDFGGESLPPDVRRKLRKQRKDRRRRPQVQMWPSPNSLKIGVERFRAAYPEPPPSPPSRESLEWRDFWRSEMKRLKEVIAKIVENGQNAKSPPAKKLKTLGEKSDVTSNIDTKILDDSLDEDLLTICSQTAEETFKKESESIAHNNTSSNVQSNIGHLQGNVTTKSTDNEHSSAEDVDLLDGDEEFFLNEELGTY